MAQLPSEFQKYLKHLPLIAGYIDEDKRFNFVEIKIFKAGAPDLYNLFKNATFEQIRDLVLPYQDDPQYGQYVRKVLSPTGEAWLRRTLSQL